MNTKFEIAGGIALTAAFTFVLVYSLMAQEIYDGTPS